MLGHQNWTLYLKCGIQRTGKKWNNGMQNVKVYKKYLEFRKYYSKYGLKCTSNGKAIVVCITVTLIKRDIFFLWRTKYNIKIDIMTFIILK